MLIHENWMCDMKSFTKQTSWIPFKDLFNFILCVYLYHECAWGCSQGSEEDISYPGSGVKETDSYGLLCVCLDLNPGPLQEGQMVLAALQLQLSYSLAGKTTVNDSVTINTTAQ